MLDRPRLAPLHSRRPDDGAVAQLGERGVRNAEVRGSIPLCSTILTSIQSNNSKSASDVVALHGLSSNMS